MRWDTILRKRIKRRISEEERLRREISKLRAINKIVCPKCKNEEIVKYGNRYTKYHVKQKYICKSCGYNFVLNPTRNRLPDSIREYVKHQKGSSRQLMGRILTKFGRKVSHVTISRIMKEG